mmetsp:Transcript_1998/g.7192  ORF Transcript_1998/g.7192 Transcript_1998/m.7192 type:complete len:535 (-) Transcript_1998:46-1650(-)|eukprot:CAMPEP_0117435002 /NCGR_PEP_ID=MMETSP0759-20121206/248_1 /TAXON_ID=63605 /ORGANISM="Percolomonas cosmopolitus, Strain WS" /LENGTH=534 /DNA_ID=CAMNT_0005226519 /DNA_START=591 /DNA_END=2195 /DNA_ORIENTATION=+
MELALIEREDVRDLRDIYGNELVCVGVARDERELVVWGKSQYLYVPFQKPVESSNSRIMPMNLTKLDAKRHIEVEELLAYYDESSEDELDSTPESDYETSLGSLSQRGATHYKRKRTHGNSMQKQRTAGNSVSVIKQIGMGGYYIAFLTTRGELFVNGLGVSWLSLFCAYKPKKVNLPASPLDPHQSAGIQQIACCDKFMLILIETGEVYVWGQLGTETHDTPALITIYQRAGTTNLNESDDSETSNHSSDRSVISLASHESYAVAITDDGQILGFGKCPSFFSSEELNKSQHNNSGGLSRKALLAPTPIYTELNLQLLSKHIRVSCGAYHLQILETVLSVNDERFDEQAGLIQALQDQLRQIKEERDVSQRRLSERNTQFDQLQEELNSKEQIIMSKNERIKEIQIEQDEDRIKIDELESTILDLQHRERMDDDPSDDNNTDNDDDGFNLDIREEEGELDGAQKFNLSFSPLRDDDTDFQTQLIIDKYRPRDETVNQDPEGAPTPFSPIFDPERHKRQSWVESPVKEKRDEAS